jgi:RimJ/RimL family protein N-acetyltransferase
MPVKIYYMCLAYRHRAESIQAGWRLGGPTGAASGSYRSFLDDLADKARRLRKGLFEGWKGCFEDQIIEPRRALTECTAWQRVLGGTGLDLFYAASYQPYPSEDSAASSADATGEDEDAREEIHGEWQEEHWGLTLTDGTYVPVREIQTEDAPALQRLFERLSERTVRLRYLKSLDELSDEKARHLAEVDGENQYALVALDPDDEEEIVAMVRYDLVEENANRAEYAALVEDRLQSRGLGIGLTRALIEAARERGIQSFDALVASENRGMIRLLRSLGLPEREQRENGSKRVEVDLFPNQEDSASN